MSMDSIPTVTVEPGALGAIVEDTTVRKRVYSVWIIIGLGLQGVVAGIIGAAGAYAAVTAVGAAWPVAVGAGVLGAVAGAYAALTPQVTTLARANTPRED